MYKSSLFLIVLFFLSKNVLGQEQDSTKLVMLNNNLQLTQEYHFSDGSTRIYNKPRWTDMVYRVPKDFLASRDYGFNKMGALIKF
jgi:hypothetical protein